MIKLNIAKWEAVLSCFFLFVNYWYGAVTILVPRISLSQLVILVDVFVVLILFFGFFQKKISLSKSGWYVILVMVIVSIFYLFTGIRYSRQNAKYNTHFLVLVSETLMSVVLASIVACNKNAQEIIKRMMPCIGVIFTFVALYSTVFYTGTMGGNWIYNDNGMNYQVISYMTAFSTGMLVFYLLEYKKIEWYIFFGKKIGYVIAIVSLIMNAYTTLVAGGRGGFAVYIFFIAYYIFYWIKESKTTVLGIVKKAGFFVGLPLMALYVLNVAMNSSVNASGINRILNINFLTSLTDRGSLYEVVFILFGERPIFGYGIGATFYEIGIWTHNFFTDILLEAGIIGVIIAICILIKGFVTSRILQKQDGTNKIWTMLFYMGLLFSMVSGYYLANVLLVWCVAFLHARSSYNSVKEKRREYVR